MIGVQTRDGSPSHISIVFDIVGALPSVQLEDIMWTYTPYGDNPDNTPLFSDTSGYTFDDVNGLYTNLTIFNVTVSDSGSFTLSASNVVGTRSATIELLVHGKCIHFHVITCSRSFIPQLNQCCWILHRV